MQMSANDSSPLYLLNDNYLGNVDQQPALWMTMENIQHEIRNGRRTIWNE